MYRFLFTARWLGLAALTVVLVALMVLAGRWQLDRYHQRSTTNARIDAARTATPAALRDALPAPAGKAGSAGRPAPATAEWSRVTATGRYDGQREILVRGRTQDGTVGFEVLTPLDLGGGVAVLVDRGWVPAPPGDATALPSVPAVPTGEVTLTGRVARSESGSGRLRHADGYVDVRRISVGQLAAELPYRLFGSYLLLDPDQPGGDGLSPVPSTRQNAWLNASYVAQWWIFAGLTLATFVWLVRREAAGPPPAGPDAGRAERAPPQDTLREEDDSGG